MPVLKFPEPGPGPEQVTEIEFGRIQHFRDRRILELKAFVNALKEPLFREQIKNDESDWLFASVMDLALCDYGVSQKSLADLLKLNTATIGRWATKQASPSKFARLQVFDAIIDILTQDIEAASVLTRDDERPRTA